MANSLNRHLAELFEDHAGSLPDVSKRRMFGCDAFFRDASIFGLIWKDGRIGLRFPETAAFDEAIGLPGAARWKPAHSEIAHWVLLPESFHDDAASLGQWIQRAHDQAAAGRVGKTPKGARLAKTLTRPRRASAKGKAKPKAPSRRREANAAPS